MYNKLLTAHNKASVFTFGFICGAIFLGLATVTASVIADHLPKYEHFKTTKK